LIQQGQVFELNRRNREGEPIWAYRYRLAGRGSRRVQRGGFGCEEDAAAALERELDHVRRERRIPRSLTLSELVNTYLAQHDVQPVTIEKLRWLLSKAISVFGDRRVGELTSQEIAEWRMTLSPGYRFEATQALRQVLHRAVVWGMIDINPAKVGVDKPTPRRKEQRPFESWVGSVEVPRPRRAAARCRCRRSRSKRSTSSRRIGRARSCSRPSGLATSISTIFVTASGDPRRSRPGSSRCAGSTISGTPSRPLLSVPAS